VGRRTDPEDVVGISVGNGCDVFVFTPSQFQQLAGSGEPVASDIFSMTGSRSSERCRPRGSVM